MVIKLLSLVSLLLVYVIYINLINLQEVHVIEKLKWPFLNIIDENGKYVDIVCIRGPLDKEEDIKSFERFIKQKKLIIGCSSYLSFPSKCTNTICEYGNFFFKGKRIDTLVDGWLHPFKDDRIIKNKNKLLLSESDFVDNIDFLNNYNIYSKKIKYDFICYCPSDENNDSKGGWHYHNKNWPLAKKTIETACNDLNLKGILVGRKDAQLNIEKNKLKRYENLDHITFIKKISECKFMIISSYEDASPRVICESILLNTPVLVNKDIIGGWKYVNSNTGAFYSENDIKKKIKTLLNRKYSPREYYFKNYGIEISGKKFRDFIVNIDSSYSKHKLLRFAIS